MLTSNINFKNFKIKKIKNIKNFINETWFKKIKFLDSLKHNYKYNYTKSQIRKFKKNKNFRIIGMGGSTLGAEAIYQFLDHKIKKKFIFINNLNPTLKNNEKKIKATNIIISKSGNTLETIANSNLLINQKKIFLLPKIKIVT